MSRPIFVLNDQGALVPIFEREYESEDIFQQMLAKFPELLLTGDDRTPYSGLLLLTREQDVPIEAGGSRVYSLDHLFVDQDGVPTLVEVKRRSDTRNRRELVAQMLDYASNGLACWNVEDLRRNFEQTCREIDKEPAGVLAEFLGDGGDAEGFWMQIAENIRDERIRMVFVADEISVELRRIVAFLNRQMRSSEMLAIEVRQFVGEGVRAFVPDLIVRPAASMGGHSSSADTMRQAWTEDRFMTVLDEKAGAEVVGVARSILDWGIKHATRFWWGEGKKDGSFGPVFCWKGTDYYPVFVWSTGVGKIQFQWLKLRPPFDSIEKRRELLDRLNAIPGIALPEDALGGRPSFPLRALVPAEARKRFLAVLDWVVDEVKENV
ncbi:hypothetical protein [Methanosphaerula subterraneus]|uniref:hypothetical protein n=1 Tax=Methanosphaerula subterraneus TaxID=3350244 RepID=UPI003F84CF4E